MRLLPGLQAGRTEIEAVQRPARGTAIRDDPPNLVILTRGELMTSSKTMLYVLGIVLLASSVTAAPMLTFKFTSINIPGAARVFPGESARRA